MPRKKTKVKILGVSSKPDELTKRLQSLVIGQDAGLHKIIPFIEAFDAGLSPVGRPAGVVLLLGPTGTGKTRTVEALAEVLHGHQKMLLRIDCGELIHDGDAAKLTGSPPGYHGHRETTPLITQERLNSIKSTGCNLSIVLFDEIEKAPKSIDSILLSILDKAVLTLGTNTTVNFETCLVFLTSNCGAREMQDIGKRPGFIFTQDKNESMEIAATKALRKRFSPELINRIDAVLTYKPLAREDCAKILYRIIQDYGCIISERLGLRQFALDYTPAAEDKLLDLGVNEQSGARELKRVVQKHFIHPVAAYAARQEIPPLSAVVLDVDPATKEFYLFISEDHIRVV